MSERQNSREHAPHLQRDDSDIFGISGTGLSGGAHGIQHAPSGSQPRSSGAAKRSSASPAGSAAGPDAEFVRLSTFGPGDDIGALLASQDGSPPPRASQPAPAAAPLAPQPSVRPAHLELEDDGPSDAPAGDVGHGAAEAGSGEVARLRARVDVLEREKGDLASRLADEMTATRDAEKHSQRLKAELDEARLDVDKLRDAEYELEAMRSQRDAQQASSSDATASLQQELDRVRAEAEEAQQVLSERLSDTASQLEAAVAERAALEARAREAEEALSRAPDPAAMTELEQRLSDTAAQLEAAKAENESAKAELEEVKYEAEGLRSEKDSLTEQLAAAARERQALEEELESAKIAAAAELEAARNTSSEELETAKAAAAAELEAAKAAAAQELEAARAAAAAREQSLSDEVSTTKAAAAAEKEILLKQVAVAQADSAVKGALAEQLAFARAEQAAIAAALGSAVAALPPKRPAAAGSRASSSFAAAPAPPRRLDSGVIEDETEEVIEESMGGRAVASGVKQPAAHEGVREEPQANAGAIAAEVVRVIGGLQEEATRHKSRADELARETAALEARLAQALALVPDEGTRIAQEQVAADLARTLAELDTSRATVEDLKARLSYSENEAQSAAGQLVKVLARSSELESQLAAAEAKLSATSADIDTRIASLEKQAEESAAAAESLRADLQAAGVDKASLEARLEELRVAHEALKSDKVALDQEMDIWNRERVSLLQGSEAIREHKELIDKDMAALKEAHAVLEARFVAVEAELAQERAEKEGAVERATTPLEARLKELESELATVVDRVTAETDAKLSEMAASRDATVAEVRAATDASLSDMAARVEVAEKRLAEMVAERDTLMRIKSDQEYEITSLNDRISQAADQSKAVSSDADRHISDALEKVRAAEAEAKDHREKNAALRAKNKALALEVETLKTARLALETEVESMSLKLRAERDTLEKTRADASAAHNKRRQLEGALNKAKDREQDLKLKVDSMVSDLTKAKLERDKAAADLVKWKEEALIAKRDGDLSARDKEREARARAPRKPAAGPAPSLASDSENSRRAAEAERQLAEAKTEISILKELVRSLKRAKPPRDSSMGGPSGKPHPPNNPRGPSARKGGRGGARDEFSVWDAHLAGGDAGDAGAGRDRDDARILAQAVAAEAERARAAGPAAPPPAALRLAPMAAGPAHNMKPVGSEEESLVRGILLGEVPLPPARDSLAPLLFPGFEGDPDFRPDPSLVKVKGPGGDPNGRQGPAAPPGFRIANPAPHISPAAAAAAAARNPLPPIPYGQQQIDLNPRGVAGPAFGTPEFAALAPDRQLQILQAQQQSLMAQQVQLLQLQQSQIAMGLPPPLQNIQPPQHTYSLGQLRHQPLPGQGSLEHLSQADMQLLAAGVGANIAAGMHPHQYVNSYNLVAPPPVGPRQPKPDPIEVPRASYPPATGSEAGGYTPESRTNPNVDIYARSLDEEYARLAMAESISPPGFSSPLQIRVPPEDIPIGSMFPSGPHTPADPALIKEIGAVRLIDGPNVYIPPPASPPADGLIGGGGGRGNSGGLASPPGGGGGAGGAASSRVIRQLSEAASRLSEAVEGDDGVTYMGEDVYGSGDTGGADDYDREAEVSLGPLGHIPPGLAAAVAAVQEEATLGEFTASGSGSVSGGAPQPLPGPGPYKSVHSYGRDSDVDFPQANHLARGPSVDVSFGRLAGASVDGSAAFGSEPGAGGPKSMHRELSMAFPEDAASALSRQFSQAKAQAAAAAEPLPMMQPSGAVSLEPDLGDDGEGEEEREPYDEDFERFSQRQLQGVGSGIPAGREEEAEGAEAAEGEESEPVAGEEGEGEGDLPMPSP